MKWSGWRSDPSGPGQVNTKSEHRPTHSESHTLRTADHAKAGSRNDHSHVVVHHNANGRSSAHGHGIRGGTRK